MQGLREINLRANILSEFIKNHVRPSQLNVSFPIALPLVKVGRSVGQKKKKNEHMKGSECQWPVKAGLLSTKAWLRGPFVRNQMVHV